MSGPPISFWSFSSVKQFEACPYSIYLQRVQRQPRPVLPEDNPLTRGTRVHKEAELFVRGEGPLTKDLRKHVDRLTELAEAFTEGRVELEEWWAFDDKWKPVYKDDPSRWVLFIPDAVEHLDELTLRITDFKTGKSFGKELRHGEQMQLGACCAFMRYPKAMVAEIEVIYLDENKPPMRRKFDRTRVAALLPRWQKRGERLTTAETFPAKANRTNCRYCDYGPNNGGTGVCPYGVEYE